jgi:branched-chain amino acid transport system substrate-binding protein
MKKGLLMLVAFGAALALGLPAAFGGAAADPGVTSKTVVLGGTFPLTGAASSYAPIPRGMQAFFSYINARKGADHKRGVGGLQIIWKYYDDAYNPTNTVQQTQRLVEQDHVFALVGGLGTEPQQAVRDYLNQRKVPQIYVSTGATFFGADHSKYKYTIGWQPDYQAEAAIYGRYIRDKLPSAKIAVLYQNDDYGKDYNAGFLGALGKSGEERVVATRTFNVTDPSVTTQLVALRASGADTLMIFATPAKTIQTYLTLPRLGWKPDHIFLNSVSATQTFMATAVTLAGAATVNGSISTYYTKDPANPSWDNDAGVKLYRQIMAKYYPQGNDKDGLYLYGMAKGWTFVQALYAAKKMPGGLTRANLLKAVDHMTDSTNPFLLPKVIVKTNAYKDDFPISQQALIQFNNGQWTPISGIIDTRPKG